MRPIPEKSLPTKTVRAPGIFFTRSLGGAYELHVSRNIPASVQQFALGCYEERGHSSHEDCRATGVCTLAYRLHAGRYGSCDPRPRSRSNFDAMVPRGAMALAEDPPFGGLWCDQPAPFFHASVSSACVGEPPDHGHEGVEVQRLGNVQVESGIHRCLDIPVGGIAGHGNGQHLASRLKRP